MTDVIIVGGGLAGLINSILLARGGMSVVLFERKNYPFHRVCGEYISNEVVPFLKSNDLFPKELGPASITRFILTSTNGAASKVPLDMGGFGISRWKFDEFLYQKAIEAGVQCHTNTSVDDVTYVDDHFEVNYGSHQQKAKWVIGAHGKRSTLDKKMDRPFMHQRSPYAGVKYHIKTDFPDDTIALHNFKDGYCGISKVEGNIHNLCYLTHRDNIRSHGNISEMEKSVMYENPFLKEIFQNSDFVLDKPMVINEINFEKKRSVENHVLMSGDSAGLIAPLCGNGMAMAIHSAKILSDILLSNMNNANHRSNVELTYQKEWRKLFSLRLYAGRKIQGLFGSTFLSNVAVQLMNIRPMANQLMKMTHGRKF